MKERFQKLMHRDKEVLVIDYSNLKAEGMIEIIYLAKELIAKENKKVVILSIFNHKNFVSPRFIQVFEKEIKDVQHLITKNAVTGISDVQRWIVKGVNLWYKNQLFVFDSVDSALDFLVA